jgi:acylphosphatase
VITRRHVWIRGRVQGVWFRQATRRTAEQLGLAGWVRNLPDGRVEAVFEGEASAVESALEFVRAGPAQARVVEVEIREEPPQDVGTRFEVR